MGAAKEGWWLVGRAEAKASRERGTSRGLLRSSVSPRRMLRFKACPPKPRDGVSPGNVWGSFSHPGLGGGQSLHQVVTAEGE